MRQGKDQVRRRRVLRETVLPHFAACLSGGVLIRHPFSVRIIYKVNSVSFDRARERKWENALFLYWESLLKGTAENHFLSKFIKTQ